MIADLSNIPLIKRQTLYTEGLSFYAGSIFSEIINRMIIIDFVTNSLVVDEILKNIFTLMAKYLC